MDSHIMDSQVNAQLPSHHSGQLCCPREGTSGGHGGGDGSSGDDTEEYEVDNTDGGECRSAKQWVSTVGFPQPSSSREADTSSSRRRSGKQKTRLENILHRLLTSQDEDKPTCASATSRTSSQNRTNQEKLICTSATSRTSSQNSGVEERFVSSQVAMAPTGCPSPTPELPRRKSRRTVKEPSRKETASKLAGDVRHRSKSDTSNQGNNESAVSGLCTTPADHSVLEERVSGGDSSLPTWWTCFLCNIPFPNDSVMLNHMQVHSEASSFPCCKCGEDFCSLDSLRKHIDTHIQEEQRDARGRHCPLCGSSFSSLPHLVHHLATHGNDAQVKVEVVQDCGGSNDYSQSPCMKDGEMEKLDTATDSIKHHRCSRCRRTFTTSDALQLHKCRKGLVKPFGCGRCGRCFTQFSNLKEHVAIHDSEISQELECYECGLKFMYSIELRRHINIHIKAEQALSLLGVKAGDGTRELSFMGRVVPKRRSGKGKRKRQPITDANRCKICSKFFPQRSYLHLHMQTHNEKRFACQYCDKKFTFKKSLEIHVRSHTGEKPYQCDLCPRQFTRQDALHKHRRIHLGVKPYVCDICGRQFGDSFELRRHINAHNQEKPYKCNLCDKAYSDNTRLKEHMFRHTGNMPYICERCGKGFARKYRYNLHMSQHAGEVKFTCETCGRGFLRRSDYNSHKLTHTTERPYKCSVCGMGFIRDNYLKRHELVHSGDKPFTCHICGKDFKRKNTLNRHMQTHDRSNTLNRHLQTHSGKLDGMPSDMDYKFPTNCTRGAVGALQLGPVGASVQEERRGEGEDRDIMRDIQAVIGVSVASMLNEIM